MSTSPAPSDFVAVIALLGSALFSPALADVLAPYAATFFASLLGVMWALSRRENDTAPGHWARGIIFVAKIVGAAMIVTIPIATWVSPKIGLPQDSYAVAPIGFLIGAVGEDWKPFLVWVRDFVMRWRSGTVDEGPK